MSAAKHFQCLDDYPIHHLIIALKRKQNKTKSHEEVGEEFIPKIQPVALLSFFLIHFLGLLHLLLVTWVLSRNTNLIVSVVWALMGRGRRSGMGLCCKWEVRVDVLVFFSLLEP